MRVRTPDVRQCRERIALVQKDLRAARIVLALARLKLDCAVEVGQRLVEAAQPRQGVSPRLVVIRGTRVELDGVRKTCETLIGATHV